MASKSRFYAVHRPVGRQVRVLDLLPGNPGDTYDALSYVWGDRAEELDINVSGDCFPVTRNLHGALTRIRDHEKLRTLWIDQICIEQANNDERASQVAMMRDIYRKCSCCVIWLGEVDQYQEHITVQDARAVFDFFKFSADAQRGVLSSEMPILFQNTDDGACARAAYAAFAIVLSSVEHCSYDESPATVFEQATIDLIRHEGSLRPFIASADLAHKTPGLATWAIDFASCNIVGNRQMRWWNHFHRHSEFNACGDRTLDLRMRGRSKEIELSGLLTDEVLHVGDVYAVNEDEEIYLTQILQIMRGALRLVQEFRSSHPSRVTYTDGESWKSAYWRTMVGDLLMAEFPVQRVEDRHEPFVKDLLGQEYLDDSTNLWESVCGMIPNHAFFITLSGYIGIGPARTQPGDEVWIFHGGKVPFVMRRTGVSKAIERQETLNLVGDAYVHGIMDGQAMEVKHEARRVVLS
ncbi:heterokaryon incompatibility protein-domain-containing protein [Paraphoma chrysanthemicola]|nr:heterokaryon incompatibility protein-domain-containing protein [Paraphoma chrysanthemicola]